MTSGMAALGLLPAALSHEAGAETARPFAVVIVGGLISSTILTLIVLPIAASIFLRPPDESGDAEAHNPPLRLPALTALSLVLGMACFLCADARASDSRFVLVPVSDREISIQSIRIAGESPRPMIAGTVKASTGGYQGRRQHLEISVLAPDGKLLARVKANYQPNPIPADRRNPFHTASYAKRLPLDPPPGSTIRVEVVSK
jgi:hypothetical protein